MADFLDGATAVPQSDFLAGATPVATAPAAAPAPAAVEPAAPTLMQRIERNIPIYGPAVEGYKHGLSPLQAQILSAGTGTLIGGQAVSPEELKKSIDKSVAQRTLLNVLTDPASVVTAATLGTGGLAGAAENIGAQTALGVGQEKLDEMMPNHPIAAQLIGIAASALAGAGLHKFSAAMAERRAANMIPERLPVEPEPPEPPGGADEPQSGETQPQAAAQAQQPAAAAPPPTQPEGLGNAPREKAPISEATAKAIKAAAESPDNTELQPDAKVFIAKTDQVKLDPERFQHKLYTDLGTGEAQRKGQNLDIEKWDEAAATPLTVWRQKDGQFYVVNGHQRYAAAKRLGVKDLPVQVLDEGDTFPGAIASNVTAEKARAYGAELNIKQNQGTALDFAKYMRDSGKSLDDIRAGGVPMSRGKAEDAIAMSKLSPSLFREVTLERFPQEKAVAVGREFGDNPAAQDALFRKYREYENEGREFSDKKFDEWVKIEKGAGTFTSRQKNLFGEDEVKSYSPEMADVLKYTREKLGKERRTFSNAKDNAEMLAAGNTQVDKDAAEAIKDAANQRTRLLDSYAYASGTQANAAVRKYAEILANTPRAQRAGVFKDAYKEIYGALENDHRMTFQNSPGLAGTNPQGGEGQGNLLAGRTPTAPPAAMSGQQAPVEEPAPPTAAEQEAAGQRSMFGGMERGQLVLPQSLVQGAQTLQARLKTYKRQIQRAFAPTSVSDTAGAAGAMIGRRNAEMENDFTLAVNEMDRARKFMDTLDRPASVDFISRMEGGRRQADPALQGAADILRQILDRQRDAVQRLGVGALNDFYENYFPHIWTDPKKAQEVYTSLRGSLEGSKSFLKRRTFDSFADGYNAGLTPVSWNPVDLAMLKYYEMGKFISGQKIMQDLKNQGWAKFVKLGADGPPGWAKINDKIARVSQWSEADKGFINRGQWYAPEEISRLVDRHLGPGLKHATGEGGGIYDLVRGVNNTMNQFQLGLSAFHVATTTMNSLSSHMALAIQKATSGDLRGALRHAAIGMSGPGALIHDYMKGRKIYRQFYGMEDYGPAFQNTVKNYIESGANFDQSRPFIDNWVQAWQRAWRDGNVAKGIALTGHAAVETLARPIFEHLVPKAKAAAFMDLAQHELAKLPANAREADRLRVLSAVQNSIDNRFGMLNYDKLYWDNKWKDAAFIGVRAVGWNVGDVREFGGGLKDLPKVLTRKEITPRAAYAIAMPLTAALYGAIYQHAKTGQFPGLARKDDGSIDARQSLINYLAPKTGGTLADGRPERVWLPGYQKDILSMLPASLGGLGKAGQTVAHKLSPLISLGYDIYQNEDYFHRQIRDPEAPLATQAGQVGKFALATGGEPLTVQNLLRRGENRKSGGAVGIESAFGFTPAGRDVTNSPMMNYMDEALKDRSPQGGETPQQFERQSKMRELEDQIRAGKKPDVQEALRGGALSGSDVERAMRIASRPYIEARFSELPLDKALKAYTLGDAAEKQRVYPIILQKIQRGALARTPPAQRPALIEQLKQIAAEQRARAQARIANGG